MCVFERRFGEGRFSCFIAPLFACPVITCLVHCLRLSDPPHNTQSQLTVGRLEERRGGGLELMDDYGIQRTSTKEAEVEEEEGRGCCEEQDREVEKTTD